MNTLEDFIKNAEEDVKITEELSYDDVIQKLQEAKENDVPIEEGIIGAIVGGLTGATFGPKIGQAICRVLGIDPKGSLGNLITSRLITTAIGTQIGIKV